MHAVVPPPLIRARWQLQREEGYSLRNSGQSRSNYRNGNASPVAGFEEVSKRTSIFFDLVRRHGKQSFLHQGDPRWAWSSISAHGNPPGWHLSSTMA